MIIMSVRRTFLRFINILASIKLIIVMCTCTPQSIFFFPLLHSLTCSITCGLHFLLLLPWSLSIFFLPIVLYVPYIFIIFHQHSFDVQLYISSSCWLSTESERSKKKCTRMDKKRRRPKRQKRKITLLCMDVYSYGFIALTRAKSQKKVVCKSLTEKSLLIFFLFLSLVTQRLCKFLLTLLFLF